MSTQPQVLGSSDLPIASVFGANVYRYRVLRLPKMSQDALAKAAQRDRNTIAQIEAARDPSKAGANPTLETMEAIADVLGVRVADLLRLDEQTMRVILYGEELDLPPTPTLTSVNLRRTGADRRRSDHIQSPLLSSLT